MSSIESTVGADLTLVPRKDALVTATETIGTEVTSSQSKEAPAVAPNRVYAAPDDFSRTNRDPTPGEQFLKIFPPDIHPKHISERASVFLAGTIDQGEAPEWQRALTRRLLDLPVDIYNPRREDWDPNAKQSADNKYFNDQVNWEMDMLKAVDVIAMFLVGDKSPISLFEAGMYFDDKKMIVCSSKKQFYRHGNIEIASKRGKFMLVENYEELVAEVRLRLALKSAAAAALSSPENVAE